MPAVPASRTLLGAVGATLVAATSAAALPVVAIDAGHGGSDSGAIGALAPEAVTGLEPRFNPFLQPVLLEKDVNLDVANRLNAWLAARGFPTLMTRSTDNAGGDVPYISEGADLKARTDASNAALAEIFVSIHQNSSRRTGASGTETYVRSSAPEVTHLLAAGVQRTLVACLGLPDRGVKERSFYVLRNTAMPAILVEGAFLSNEVDAGMLASPDVRQRMAEAIGGAIFQYAGLGDPGPICSGVGVAPPPVPKKIVLTRAGRKLTQRAGINPKRGDLWVATVRDASGAPMSSIPVRARLPNGKGVNTTSRPDGKALLAVPRRKGRVVVAVAMPGIKVAARAKVPARRR
ncbi:MAG: N-acetylmuramoyl-L-alanine amidase [Miltoncostaeaceae bacterium]